MNSSSARRIVAAVSLGLLFAARTAAAAGQEAASPVLKGIVLVDDPKLVVPDGITGVEGVRVEGRTKFDDPILNQALQPMFGKPLSTALVLRIRLEIIAAYRRHHRSVVDVITPPQKVTSGVVQIVVLEGKVGKIKVEGNKEFSAEYLSGLIRAKPGDTLDSALTEEDVDWINRNPFRHVDLVYAKGAELGSTDLVLRTSEGRPYRVYAGYDDSGTNATQNERLTFGAGWGDVFGGDGQLNYQYNTSPDFRSVRAHSATLVQPLPWRHVLTLLGSYADSRAILPSPLNMTGYNWQTSLSYEVPLPTLSGLKHSVVAGFDFKRSNNDLTFGGTSVFAAATDVDQFRLSYSADLRDGLGETSARLTGFVSPGGLSSGNNDAAFGASRAYAHVHYHYLKAELNRVTKLPAGMTFVNLVTAQTSDANLIASEQMGFGGFDTVRGVDTRVLNTDRGYLINTELRSPFVPLAANFRRLRMLNDQVQLLFFVDYGAGGSYRRLAGEAAESKLLTVGPGVRYKIAENVSFRFDYGWQLKNEAQPDRTAASRGHFGLMVSY